MHEAVYDCGVVWAFRDACLAIGLYQVIATVVHTLLTEDKFILPIAVVDACRNAVYGVIISATASHALVYIKIWLVCGRTRRGTVLARADEDVCAVCDARIRSVVDHHAAAARGTLGTV